MTAALEFEHVSKRFGGVQALQDVSFTVALGTVHAVVGENGAGKSTLMNILAGVVAPDEGGTSVAGEQMPVGSPADARAFGVEVVYQELSLFPELSVARNVHVGREIASHGIVSAHAMDESATRALRAVGARIDPRAPVESLTIGQQQLVEIARAVSHQARILVLDEPNSALSAGETAVLMETIRRLRSEGVTVLLVSHRLDEVFEVADSITVLRNGRHISTAPTANRSVGDVVTEMVGRPAAEFREPATVTVPGDLRLRLSSLSSAPRFTDVSLDARAGEIVGLAGLEGSGAGDLLDALFGVNRPDAGTIEIDGKPVKIRTPTDAVRAGVALVPRDRRGQGLMLDMSVEDNLALCSLGGLTSRGFVSRGRKARIAAELIRDLGIRVGDARQSVAGLSGGNQQKVVIGKWLATKPRLLLLNDPTRGIDVGAKSEVHRLVQRLAGSGMTILVTSSEFEELLHICHRVLVFYRGRTVGFLETHAPDAGDRIAALATTGADLEVPA